MEFHLKTSLALLLLAILAPLQWAGGDNIRLPDQTGPSEGFAEGGEAVEERRNGRHLLDFIGLGTGSNVDPYVARTNGNCLNGELSECFKTQALNTFDEFFSKDSYSLTQNVRILRMPQTQLRSLAQEPFEFSSEARATDSEWDHLVKFALRKVERFIKSTGIEVQISDDVTEGGRYSPSFIEDIAGEIDVIEDKKDSLFSRNRLKRLFIPLLLILKVFKLKLLLFLPLILGLASFKKLLAFLAIIVPGVIGYFKLCRPQNNYGNHHTSGLYTQYSPQGVGGLSYNAQHPQQLFGENEYYHHHEPHFANPYKNYYRDNGNSQSEVASGASGSVRFGDDSHAQNLAYQSYSPEYRSKKTDSVN